MRHLISLFARLSRQGCPRTMTHSWIYIAALIKLYVRRNELNSVCEGPRCALPCISFLLSARGERLQNFRKWFYLSLNKNEFLKCYTAITSPPPPEKLLGKQLEGYTARKASKIFSIIIPHAVSLSLKVIYDVHTRCILSWSCFHRFLAPSSR